MIKPMKRGSIVSRSDNKICPYCHINLCGPSASRCLECYKEASQSKRDKKTLIEEKFVPQDRPLRSAVRLTRAERDVLRCILRGAMNVRVVGLLTGMYPADVRDHVSSLRIKFRCKSSMIRDRAQEKWWVVE